MEHRVCFSDCDECGEVKTSTESSINIVTECGCGVNVIDNMVEEDRLYPVYQQIFGTWDIVTVDKERDSNTLISNRRISDDS